MSLPQTNFGLHSTSAEIYTGVSNSSIAVNLASGCAIARYAGMTLSRILFHQYGLVVGLIRPGVEFDINKLVSVCFEQS